MKSFVGIEDDAHAAAPEVGERPRFSAALL